MYFGVVNNGDGQRSYLRLDDVVLVVCPPLGPDSPSATPSRVATATATATATALPATSTPAAPATALPTATGVPSSTPVATATARLSATPVGTITPVATATPVCMNLLPEGDFEAPDLTSWVVSGDQPAQRVAAPVAAGQGALALGLTAPGLDGFGYAAVARDVTWPTDVVSATLFLTARPLNVGPGDAFVVELRRTMDGVRQVVHGPDITDPTGRWTSHAVPLDPKALGAEAQVYLAVLNRALAGGPGAVTAVAVDTLRLEVCTQDDRLRPRAYLPLARRDEGVLVGPARSPDGWLGADRAAATP